MIHNKAKQKQTELWSNSTMCKLIFHQLAPKSLNDNAVQRSTCTTSVIQYSMGKKKELYHSLIGPAKIGVCPG